MDSESAHDRQILRHLAARWMELATSPLMAERIRLWTLEKDLCAERPMVLVETLTIEEYVTDDELHCCDAGMRGLERWMRWQIRHTEEVGDDFVLPPSLRVRWHVHHTDYGVDIARACSHYRKTVNH